MASFKSAKELRPGWTIGLGSAERDNYQVVTLSEVTPAGENVHLVGRTTSGDEIHADVGGFDRLPILSKDCDPPPAETPSPTNVRLDLTRQFVDDFLEVLESHPEGQRKLLDILRNMPTTDS